MDVVPYCDVCSRHWTPTSMQADGSCPSCGKALELRRPLAPTGDVAAPSGEDEARPSAPWHFKVMLLALALYLVWRGVQGLAWIAQRL